MTSKSDNKENNMEEATFELLVDFKATSEEDHKALSKCPKLREKVKIMVDGWDCNSNKGQ